MSEPKFRQGMIAWSPKTGFGLLTIRSDLDYPIEHEEFFYTKTGRLYSDDKYPSLLTVEEAAKLGYEMTKEEKKRLGLIKKRMVTVERWMLVYPNAVVYLQTEQDAINTMKSGCLNCVKLTGTYEEEVEA